MKKLYALCAFVALAGCSYNWDGLRPINNAPPDASTDTGEDVSTVFPDDRVDAQTPVDMPAPLDVAMDVRPDVVSPTDVPRDVAMDAGVDVAVDVAPVDVAMDVAPVDVAMDVAPVDVAPVDVARDVVTDTGVDVPIDTGVDTGVDVPCSAHVVINEFAVAGPMGASDEFVELFNTGACTVSLDNWTLKYSSAGGSTPSTLWTGPLGLTLAPGAYAVLAPSTGTSYASVRTAILNTGMAAAGGAIAIFPPLATTPHDGVAYGALTGTSPFIEGSAAAPVPTASQSTGRLPNGADTNVNSADFRVTGAITAGAVNR